MNRYRQDHGIFRIGRRLIRVAATALIVLIPSSVQGAVEEQANAAEAKAEAETKETAQAMESGAEGSSSARGAPSRSPAEGSSSARGAPSRSPAEGSSARGDPSAEVFLPTEEISEDYAAPFPVDI